MTHALNFLGGAIVCLLTISLLEYTRRFVVSPLLRRRDKLVVTPLDNDWTELHFRGRRYRVKSWLRTRITGAWNCYRYPEGTPVGANEEWHALSKAFERWLDEHYGKKPETDLLPVEACEEWRQIDEKRAL